MSTSTLSVIESAPQATKEVSEGNVVEGAGEDDVRSTSVGTDSLDFIGSSSAFKDLFSLPYSGDQSVSVAVHKLGDTLLVDVDPGDQGIPSQDNEGIQTPLWNQTPSATPIRLPDKERATTKDTVKPMSSALVALSELESRSEALVLVQSFIDSQRTVANGPPRRSIEGVPNPDEQIGRYIASPREPRDYISWQFRNMNLLVGSDSIVYRSPENTSNALSIRVENVCNLQALIQRHQEMRQSGEFVADHQFAKLQQAGKPSYAQATARSITPESKNECGPKASHSFAAPDLDQVQMQSCLVSTPTVPVGSFLSSNSVHDVVRMEKNVALDQGVSKSAPVSTALDIYLDNIMANVPQLALCLQEKGFIQSVKLLKTEHIPASLLRPATTNTSTPFEVLDKVDESERVFSPDIMEMNASTLLGFLKTQCSKENATYLLRREAGQSNIQLYDISAISSQRQQKWNWWLAMMSYRFANRLQSLTLSTSNKALARKFRSRQRNLLQNALDLLDALADITGKTHESLTSAIREKLADTFLADDDDVQGPATNLRQGASKTPPATRSSPLNQPYSSVTTDALNKSHDHLVEGIRVLWRSLEKDIPRERRTDDVNHMKKRSPVKVESVDADDESSDDDNDIGKGSDALEAAVSQLFGLHNKMIGVLLRLAEIHLQNYYSSSAMQALRNAARRIADSLYLITLQPPKKNRVVSQWLSCLQMQYTWLWEHCGHFARSFAADDQWRDRGHASGDDVVSVIQEVDAALRDRDMHMSGKADEAITEAIASLRTPIDILSEKSNGSISLMDLHGIIDSEKSLASDKGRTAAIALLQKQRLLQREHRKVLVVSCIAYGRAISSGSTTSQDGTNNVFLGLIKQRLGDALNEMGKVMMDEVRRSLSAPSKSSDMKPNDLDAAAPLLFSAVFWFEESLATFEECGDLRNLALLRCNLCQCSKLRANAIFAPPTVENERSVHAETCLQEAAQHLQLAHETLGQRETDPPTWDMVSDELAATLLVLGVRRRQGLLGSGNLPVIVQAMRLSPGAERSIVDPMERSLGIYERAGNHHQAAAVHYQLALFYTKIWTCQRDESKTREKLSAAFRHFHLALAYFSQHVAGNESTFCLLCLDLSALYSTVSGEEGIRKAVARCLDTVAAFRPETIALHRERMSPSEMSTWLETMQTIATSVDERLFKLIRSLVKLEESTNAPKKKGKTTYKDLYRVGLTAKLQCQVDQTLDATTQQMHKLHHVLESLRHNFAS